MLENAGDLGAFCNAVKERAPVLGPRAFSRVALAPVC